MAQLRLKLGEVNDDHGTVSADVEAEDGVTGKGGS